MELGKERVNGELSKQPQIYMTRTWLSSACVDLIQVIQGWISVQLARRRNVFKDSRKPQEVQLHTEIQPWVVSMMYFYGFFSTMVVFT